MIVTTREAGGAVILAAEGRLDTGSAPELEARCRCCVEEKGACHIILDVSNLDYVSSAGLRVILALAKQLQAAGGRFALCGASGMVRETLDLAGIASIVPVSETVEDALDEGA